MQTVTRAIYVLFGVGAIAAGVAGLLSPGLVIPEVRESSLTAHLVREQSAGFVFIGVMFLWCWRHYELRRPVHFGLLLFTVIFAAIHWAGGYGNIRLLAVTTLPAVVLAGTTPWKGR